MLALILGIETAAALIQRGLVAVDALIDSVRQGVTTVKDAGDAPISADQLGTRIAEVLTQGAAAGDNAAGRVDARAGVGGGD